MQFYSTLCNLLIGNYIYIYIIYLKNIYSLIILFSINKLAIASKFAIVYLWELNYLDLSMSMLYLCSLRLVIAKNTLLVWNINIIISFFHLAYIFSR